MRYANCGHACYQSCGHACYPSCGRKVAMFVLSMVDDDDDSGEGVGSVILQT